MKNSKCIMHNGAARPQCRIQNAKCIIGYALKCIMHNCYAAICHPDANLVLCVSLRDLCASIITAIALSRHIVDFRGARKVAKRVY